MSSILFSLPELFKSYKNWLSKNPDKIGDYETSIKWISYFIAGRINNSHVVSELVYCLSNLLVLFNDRLINNLRQLEIPSSGDKLKLWLTIVEYSEVFFELSASKLWGNRGKWLIVVAVQIFKCVCRMFLIFHHKEAIVQTPPIPVLERRNLQKAIDDNQSLNNISEFQETSFKLKHSGRLVRRIEASPPIAMRNWKSLKSNNNECENIQSLEQALIGKQLVAETLYIFKPIVHLATLGCFGEQTWKPWVISLAMDLASLHLYGTCKKNNILTRKQKLQISKRTVVLLLYLLKSPFYERKSEDKINALLNALSANVPLARLICGPLGQYLPFWQSTYFYMWST